MMKLIDERPLDVNIETTNTCVLKCRFCCNRLYKRSHKVMDMQLFQKICHEYADIGGGVLGISSMQSDVGSDLLLFERLTFLEQFGSTFQLFANTPLLLVEKYSDEELLLFLKSFTMMHVSVSGHDQASYKNMVGLDGFKILESNLLRSYQLGKQHKLDLHDKLYLSFRTYDKNILFSSPFYKKITQMFSTVEVRDSYFDWYGSIKQDDLPIGATLFSPDNSKQTSDCVASMATLSVAVDGKVVGCGCLDWNSEYVVGDSNTQTMLEIWHSQSSRAFRSVFSEQHIPKICMTCGLYTPARDAFSRPCLRSYKPSDGLYHMV